MKNKQQKHPKVHYQQYLVYADEPMDDGSRDTPAALEAEMLGNRYDMRRRFRRIAQSMRKRYPYA